MKHYIGKDSGGRDFSLPADLVTQTLAILAKKGAGKSYTASVMVESLLSAGQVPVIIDPTGAWWGLKSSADGLAAAFPVVVFGGDHADLPLEEGAGEALARAIVEQRFPAIIDLSLFRKAQVKRFVTPFLETFYRLNRQPLHLVVDEADDICPQKPFGDEAAMVGALEDVVKRGRKKGIGCTLITQRPADLAKQVLTQCEMLVALRLTHPLDIKAVMDWVNVHADPKPAKAMVESLPGLPIGTAYFWSPGWGDIFERVAVRKRQTFDSGATPKDGDPTVARPAMAAVDIVKLGSEITAAVQRAKDNDPKELRRKVETLTMQLQLAQEEARENRMAHMDMAKVAPAPIRVDVAVLTDRDRVLLARCADLLEESKEHMGHAEKVFAQLRAELTEKLAAMAKAEHLTSSQAPYGGEERRYLERKTVESAARQVARVAVVGPGAIDLPEGERRILIAVAQYDEGRTREQLTVLTGYKKSSRDTYLQRLRSRGLVETGNRIVATQAGVAALGRDFQPLPTGFELQDYWISRLPTGEARILKILIGQPHQWLTREKITEETGYLKSSRDTYLQRLSSRELIETSRAGVRASANLFETR